MHDGQEFLRAIVALSSPDLSVPEVKLTDQSASAYTFLSGKRKEESSTLSVTRQLASLPEEELLRAINTANFAFNDPGWRKVSEEALDLVSRPHGSEGGARRTDRRARAV